MLNENPDVVLFTDICSPGFGRYAGTYRIASEMRAAGYTVQVIEYFTKWNKEQILAIIKKFVTKDTLWVGLSTTFLEYERMFGTDKNRLQQISKTATITGRDDWPELVDEIRSINPNCKIVAGGTKVKQIRPDDDTFDIIVHGQGQDSLLELTENLVSRFPNRRNYTYNSFERF